MEAEGGEGRRFRVPKNTKDPAFFTESVITHPGIAVAFEIRVRDFGPLELRLRHGCLPLSTRSHRRVPGSSNPTMPVWAGQTPLART